MEYIITILIILKGVIDNDIRCFYVAGVCASIFIIMAFITDIIKIKEGAHHDTIMYKPETKNESDDNT